MAINKTVNKSTKTHGAMKNCMEYVLKESKITSSLVYVSGPFNAPEITYETVYHTFLDEKKIWNKDSGRMYAHNIISWHEDEDITPEEAFAFGQEFIEKWFDGFQTLLAVHQDRNHIHLHMVTNTVSYIDGHKLHTTKKELENMKQFTNQMCIERGLSVAKKGRDYYGEKLSEGHVQAWSKDKYHMLLHNAKDSYVAACAVAVIETKATACSKDEFIQNMKKKGWHVLWKPTRKHITFVNDDGQRVRDRNINSTFNMNISKEELEHEFIRNNEYRQSRMRNVRTELGRVDGNDKELERYYRQLQETIERTSENDRTEGFQNKEIRRREIESEDDYQREGRAQSEFENGLFRERAKNERDKSIAKQQQLLEQSQQRPRRRGR